MAGLIRMAGSAILLLAVVVSAGCGGDDERGRAAADQASAGQPSREGAIDQAAQPCHRPAVESAVREFLQATSSGDRAALEQAVAPEPAFRVFSQGLSYSQRTPRRLFFTTMARASALSYLLRRQRRGDRMRLHSLSAGGSYDRALGICNIGFVIRRRIGTGPWRLFVGKGALDQRTKAIAVWNTGGLAPRAVR